MKFIWRIRINFILLVTFSYCKYANQFQSVVHSFIYFTFHWFYTDVELNTKMADVIVDNISQSSVLNKETVSDEDICCYNCELLKYVGLFL